MCSPTCFRRTPWTRRSRPDRGANMPLVTDLEGIGPSGRERAALVGLITGDTRRTHVEDALDELAGLADAADIEPVIRFTQDRNRPDPATLIGSGKLEMLKAACQ